MTFAVATPDNSQSLIHYAVVGLLRNTTPSIFRGKSLPSPDGWRVAVKPSEVEGVGVSYSGIKGHGSVNSSFALEL